jgi:hypothetical protein
MELTISIIGASVAVLVSLIGAWLANRSSIILQTRKLKEQHYIDFVTAVHNLCADNKNRSATSDYVKARDVLITVASSDVVCKIFDYENYGIAVSSDIHDKYLTELMKAIRKDLKIRNTGLPTITFKKVTI